MRCSERSRIVELVASRTSATIPDTELVEVCGVSTTLLVHFDSALWLTRWLSGVEATCADEMLIVCHRRRPVSAQTDYLQAPRLFPFSLRQPKG